MRFCVNCGRQLRDGEVCTCQQQGRGSQGGWKGAGNTLAGARSWLRKFWPFIAGGAALVAVAIVLCCTVGGGTYKTPVNSVIQILNDQETDLVKIARRLLPDFVEGDAYRLYTKMQDSGIVKDGMDEAEDALKDLYDYLEDYYGRDLTFTCEITDRDDLSKRELKSAQKAITSLYADYLEDVIDQWKDMDDDEREDMADEADMTVKELNDCVKALERLGNKLEKAKVTKGYELTVSIVIEGKKEDGEYEDLTLRVIKVNGDWMLDFTSLSDSTALGLAGGLF